MGYKKDPDATLDFAFNWSDWLATGETISSYTITAQDGITLETAAPHEQSESNGKVTFWLSGGTANTWYTVACKIITNAGRTDERTMNILVLDR
jgi:hypothetical protein